MLQMLIGTNLPFMRYRRFAYMFSGAWVLATVIWLVVHGGPKYSVDFTGGTMLQVQTSRVIPADEVRRALAAAGFRSFALQQVTGAYRDEYLRRMRREGNRAL